MLHDKTRMIGYTW